MKYIKYLAILIILLLVGEIYSQGENIFSADSLFNLGNDAYSANQFDKAIFNYEKAKLLDPGSNDIAVNLQLANEQLSTDIIEIEPFFLASWWQSISEQLLPGGWKVVSVVILFCLLGFVYFYFFKNKPENKNVFYSITGLLLVLFIMSILAGVTRQNQIFDSPFAIVFDGDHALYLGPDLVSEEVKNLTGGNKLRILDEDGEWYKVSAMDSEQGWIKKQDVQLIRFEENTSPED